MTRVHESPVSEVDASQFKVTTLLGRDSHFEGKLTFDGVVRVEGRFRGEIQSSGTLIIMNDADVSAEVSVGSCIIQGSYTGNLTAQESVEIKAPARVKGTVATPALQVERGVLLDGKCVMSETGRSSKSPDAEPPEVNMEVES